MNENIFWSNRQLHVLKRSSTMEMVFFDHFWKDYKEDETTIVESVKWMISLADHCYNITSEEVI